MCCLQRNSVLGYLSVDRLCPMSKIVVKSMNKREGRRKNFLSEPVSQSPAEERTDPILAFLLSIFSQHCLFWVRNHLSKNLIKRGQRIAMPLLVRRTWENKQHVTDVSHTAYMFLDDVWVWRLQMSQHLTMKIRRLRELCVLEPCMAWTSAAPAAGAGAPMLQEGAVEELCWERTLPRDAVGLCWKGVRLLDCIGAQIWLNGCKSCMHSWDPSYCSYRHQHAFQQGWWLSPGDLTRTSPNNLLALLACIGRSNSFQELCRPQHQYLPCMPILTNHGHSLLTGCTNAWGLWITSCS